MTYGVTPQGFIRPSLQEILDETNADQRSTISQGLDQSPESTLGQLNAIHARQLSLAWETLETCYEAFDPDRAEDFLLEALCKLTGTTKEGASKSQVPVTVNLDDGTVLLAGEHFAHVEEKPGVRFTPLADIEADSGDGDYTGTFVAENAGPVAADNGTLTVIATTVVGWNSITNTADASLGTVADGDLTLRTKREEQLAAAGSQTALAIKTDVFQLGNWIKTVEVFENEEDAEDADGRPPHSFEVLIHDEGGPLDADDQIAQAIWNNKPSGNKSFGIAGDQGTAIDETGAAQTVAFSRVTTVPIYITMDIAADADFTDTAGVETYIAEQSDEKFGSGDDVIALFVRGLPIDFEGVHDVPGFEMSRTSPASGQSNVVIALREAPDFDTGNITVTKV